MKLKVAHAKTGCRAHFAVDGPASVRDGCSRHPLVLISMYLESHEAMTTTTAVKLLSFPSPGQDADNFTGKRFGGPLNKFN